jgi:flagellar biosynthesis/type III secretory pathway M-ring protein FliF/YscJ
MPGLIAATLIVTAFAAALVLAGLILLWIRSRQLAARLDRISAQLGEPALKPGDRAGELLEIKNFHDEFLSELESLLSEAYRAKDKERVQQLQRMRERLETLRARTLDRTIRALDGAKPDSSAGTEKGKKGR